MPFAGGGRGQFRRTCRDLVTRLNIVVPVFSAGALIERFCSDLFDEPTIDWDRRRIVAIRIMAEKIAERMRKDWIDQGRKPAGVAAAALVIASRIHGVHVGQEDVSRVCSVSTGTIRKRLLEFRRTKNAREKAHGEFLALQPDPFHPTHYEGAAKKVSL